MKNSIVILIVVNVISSWNSPRRANAELAKADIVIVAAITINKIPKMLSDFQKCRATTPTSSNENFNPPPPRRSELVSGWLRFTRAWIKALRRLLFRIPIMVCVCEGGGGEGEGGVKSVEFGINRKDPCGFPQHWKLSLVKIITSLFLVTILLKTCPRQTIPNLSGIMFRDWPEKPNYFKTARNYNWWNLKPSIKLCLEIRISKL